MRSASLMAMAALLALACSCPAPATEAPTAPVPGAPPAATPTDGRRPAIAADHPLHARVEGTSFQNGCTADADCHIGGCSQEVCSAEEGVASTCEAPADGWPTQGASCGCVAGQCSWYAADGAAPPAPPAPDAPPVLNDPPVTPPPDTPPGPATGALPAQGTPCDAAGHCAAGLTCMTYYGIAGPRGPKFTSCEVPCKGGAGACPDGQRCTTIADGPGRVCRP